VGAGRAKKLANVRVTDERTAVPAVVVVHAKAMKEPWCLATSLVERTAQDVVTRYGKRFSMEETFRDEKDSHFGLGLSATHIKDGLRRDRLLFVVALAHALLTLLGAASEATGLDRTLKSNTSPKRQLSLFRQGLYWYHAMPNTRPEWLERIMTLFCDLTTHGGPSYTNPLGKTARIGASHAFTKCSSSPAALCMAA
jgi:hypothetical protein